ncbi:sigma 54-interacting transcriptional regulator [candidate division KSB1 bacterium]|nr:sigma 54-interacting transcriptional regulator [candidate division KSB1 bacterium]
MDLAPADQLQVNLLRLWQHEALQQGAPAREEIRPVLTDLMRVILRPHPALVFAEGSPEARVIRGLFPAGLPSAGAARELAEALRRPLELDARDCGLVGDSVVMRELLEVAARLAPTTATVLISGETGTGKELLARFVHTRSLCGSRPLVTMNCAALSESLLLSELFGYEPGAFTGASARGRQGKLEAADGGGLFLDEIGDLPAAGQAALLRFLDSGEIQKLGRVKPIQVNARLICATNRQLEPLVAAGAFRADLYYRIALLPLALPPLRDRLEDLPLLVREFMVQLQRSHRRARPDRVADEAMNMLLTHGWPGNVRELRFTLERAFLLCDEEAIAVRHLPALAERGPDAKPDSRGSEIAGRLAQVRSSLFRDRDHWARFLCARMDREISNSDVTAEFDLSEAAARVRLSTLVSLGLLTASGAKRGRRYRVHL